MTRYSASTPENTEFQIGDLLEVFVDNNLEVGVVCDVWGDVTNRPILSLDIRGIEWVSFYHKLYQQWVARQS